MLAMGIDGNKWPFKEIDMPRFKEVLNALIKPENRPVLVHCNKGKHRTGSVIASLRLVRGWALSAAFNEYLIFSGARSRLEDQVFIEMFYMEHGCVIRSAIEENKEKKNEIGKKNEIRKKNERVTDVTSAAD